GLIVATLVFLGGFVAILRWALRDIERYRDDRLNYLAGLEVAEQLLPLVSRGYRLFHDIPAEGELSDRNLDHVAVGPNGVALIEGKTRRKGRPRAGSKEHVVVYDGRQLIWSWGEEGREIDQVVAEADWLKKLILQLTGITTNVKPVIAVPGWWVETTSRGTVIVTPSNTIATAVEGNGPRVLSDAQIDLIARQLDERCRDVED
ncbi:MAG: nuclease-related domain-containing protein, partial [Opitutaceae bacterium]